MMSRAIWRLVLLISCAHALVHVFELALPSTEQLIVDDYPQRDAVQLGARRLPSTEQLITDDYDVGKVTTGWLSAAWRLPWGLGALVAGLLVDRYGSRRMLAIYLLVCGACCAAVATRLPLPALFVAMAVMGAGASIYHPAGLALISHETSAVDRPRALGLHGIFGSLGIGCAPLIAALVLDRGMTWRQYYAVLAVPGVLLGMAFAYVAWRHGGERATLSAALKPRSDTPTDDAETADWRSFFTLTLLALMQGIVYSAVLSFLTRYLSGWRPDWLAESNQSFQRYTTSFVLIVGCVGQYLAGRFGRADRLERQLTLVTLANAPLLVWMAFAVGQQRMLAAAAFAIVHFMHQPLYNSLIAKYTPRRRRSLCYGFSFAMGLGVGSVGALWAGYSPSDTITYLATAGVAVLAACIGGVLCVFHRKESQLV
jgi:MFS family permease